MKKLFSLLAFVVCLTLCGSGIDLSSLSPSYASVAGKIDVAALMKYPEARQFFASVPREVRETREIFFGTDAAAERAFLLCRFRDEAAWQRLWERLKDHLKPLPAERRIMLFELKNAVDSPAKMYFAVLAPRVAGFYYESAATENYRCDYTGAPSEFRDLYHGGMPFVCGGELKVRGNPLSGIKSFLITAERNDAGKPVLYTEVECKDQLAASMTMLALQSMIAAALQQHCQLTPEQCAEIMKYLKTSQSGKIIRLEFSGLDTLIQMMSGMVTDL